MHFHLCLLHDEDLDVRRALRAGGRADDTQRRVREILLRAVGAKPTGHGLARGVHTRSKRMHQLGG